MRRDDETVEQFLKYTLKKYAEIEFNSVEEANNFTAPEFLKNEVTEKTGYTMKDYWERNI